MFIAVTDSDGAVVFAQEAESADGWEWDGSVLACDGDEVWRTDADGLELAALDELPAPDTAEDAEGDTAAASTEERLDDIIQYQESRIAELESRIEALEGGEG